MNTIFSLKTQALSVRIADQSICEKLDLEIQAGEFWGILGQNGSGKTTLLHSLAGLRPTQGGEIFWSGKKLSSYSAKKRAQAIGLLFQENEKAFPQSAWEYCLAGRYPHFSFFRESEEDWKATQEALTIMQLERQKQQNILTLSGGEWRRLALAALLAQSPSLYLLDEPLNHLDLRHQKRFLRHLQGKLREKKIAVLMTLHDINMAEQYCDRVLLLYGGGDARMGLKSDLLTDENLSRLYGHPLCLTQAGERKWWAAE